MKSSFACKVQWEGKNPHSVNRKHTFINQQWAAFERSNLIKSATQTITGCRKPIHSWISCLPAWEPLPACAYLGDLQLDTNAISRSHQGPELNQIPRVGAPHHSLSSGLSAPSLRGWGGAVVAGVHALAGRHFCFHIFIFIF